MKGIVFNLLEDAVVRYHGSAAWMAMRAASGQDSDYLPQQDYADQELTRLVRAASATLELRPFEVLRWLGYEIAPQLANSYPELFSEYNGQHSLALQLESALQPQRSNSGKPLAPGIRFESTGDGGLVMRYNSPRRLCALAQGFIEGVAHLYGQEASVDHRQCMLRGDPECECVIYFHTGTTQ